MNEQIRELAVQAKEYARSHVADCRRFGYYMEYNEYELRFEKKFAELIVEECMNIVSNQTTLDTNEDFREGFNHGLKYAWTDIRKRFGVEE
jgi:hypothetical protein